MFYIILSAVLLILLYYKIIKPANYWEDKGIPYLPAWPLVGNLAEFVLKRKHFSTVIMDIYNKFQKERFVGYMHFSRRSLLIRDVDLIKQMCIKDFDYFHERQAFTNAKSDPIMSKALMSLTGEEWRKMRGTLSPAFTGSKMRNMYLLMKECADNFVNNFHGKEKVSIEMKDIFVKYTTDVIATTVFGIKTDSVNQPNNEFSKMSRFLFQMGFFQFLKIFMIQTAPAITNFFRLQVFPYKVSDFFRSVVKETISKREAEGIIRPDLIHLLMEARKGQLKHEPGKEIKHDTGFATVEESQLGKSSEKFELTDDHIVAQALLFFFAGFETSSTIASFIAYELAVHPDIQNKLQEEIDEAFTKSNGNVSYDTLLSLKYFDQVVSESLRLWAPGFIADRICTKDFVIEPVKPDEKSFVVEKDVVIIFPILAIHKDSKYFPDPERFDPERFSDENRDQIVPGSYNPFGLGPRNCIGSRFALLQVKTLFLGILSKFDIVPINKTQIPIEIDPGKMQLTPKGGMWLAFKPRKVTEI